MWKPGKSDIMYYHITRYQDICKYRYKQIKNIWKTCSSMSHSRTIEGLNHRFPTYRRQVINPRHQTPQGQSVAKPGTLLLNIRVEDTNLKLMVTCPILYSKGRSRGRNIPGDKQLQNQTYLVSESLNPWHWRTTMDINIPVIVELWWWNKHLY